MEAFYHAIDQYRPQKRMDDVMAKVKRLDPIPPGEILLQEFMRPNGISQNRLARDLYVNPARVNNIVHGRSAITAPLALRLAKYFSTTPELWMNLQGSHELRRARATNRRRIERRVRVLAEEKESSRGLGGTGPSERRKKR
jgi:addiction module HigA family antidote